MTPLCISCGEGLRDSDRFCDRCGVAQPARLTSPESYLESEAYKSRLKLRQLETLLAESIPRRQAKAEADSLRAELAQMQENLAGSVSKAELEAKVNELESARKTNEELEERVSLYSAKIEELQNILSNSVPRNELETVKSQLEYNIAILKGKLAAYEPAPTTAPNHMNSKLCPECGAKMPLGSKYCEECGIPLPRLSLFEPLPH